MHKKIIVGSIELCSLEQLNVYDIEVRVDTGAKTSSLHVNNVKKIMRQGKPWVKFDIHPDAYNVNEVIKCESPIHDIRNVKSSNGKSEERYVIKTELTMGKQTSTIEITLSDRSDMNYLMLLGRQGMGGRFLVDPAKTFILKSARDK